MTTTEAVVLAVSSASVLTTANSLYEAVVRLRRINKRKINGVRRAQAKYLIFRECRRLLKHHVALFGVLLMALPIPVRFDPIELRTVLFGTICLLLSETSLSDQRHDRRMEQMWDEAP